MNKSEDLLKLSPKSNPSNDLLISLNSVFLQNQLGVKNPNCPQPIRWDKVKFAILQNMIFTKNSKQLTCFSKRDNNKLI